MSSPVQNSSVYTFRESIVNANTVKFPGPGTYRNEDVTVTSPRQPDVLLSSSPRKPIFEVSENPPPGSYIIPSTLGRSGHRATIGKEKKRDVGDHFNTGPGSYDISQKGNSGRYISISSKEEPIKPDLVVPGPGTYDVPSSLQFLQHSGVGGWQLENPQRLQTPIKEKDGLPGVGTYNIFTSDEKKSLASKGTFGRSGRSTLAVLNDVPGPSNFEYGRGNSHSNSFSFGARIPIKDNPTEFVPGPGAYNIASSSEVKTIKIVESPKRIPKSEKKELEETPGPGSYRVKIGFEGHSERLNQSMNAENKGLGMSKRTTFAMVDRSPGPGSYNLPENKSTGVSFSSAKKMKRKRWDYRTRLPGPGSYNISSSFSSAEKGATFASKREEIPGSNMSSPGPGTYQTLSLQNSPKISFTNQLRKTLELRNPFVPSPAQYDIPGIISTMPTYLLNKRKDPY